MVKNPMRILVPIKLSYDVNQMKFDERTGEPILDAVPMIMGDMDRCALEAALQLRESLGGEVEALSIGSGTTHSKMMMDAFAMGCDKAYLIEVDQPLYIDAYTVSKVIKRFIDDRGPYDIIIMGATSQDTHSSIVPPSLAAQLGLNAAFGVDKVTVEDGSLVLEATYEDGIYVYRLSPPLLFSVTTEANTPRIPTLRDILRAKRMRYESIPIDELVKTDDIRSVEVVMARRYVTPRRREIIEVASEEDLDRAVDRIIQLFKEAEVI